MGVRRKGLAGLALLLAALTPLAAPAQYYPPPPPPGYYPAYRGGWGGPPPRYGPPRPYRRHCNRGLGGTLIGAIAGGLLGNAVAGRGDRGIGTVVGAGAGALTGRAIDRDCR